MNMNDNEWHGRTRALTDYRATGAFHNPFPKDTWAWRGYHSEEQKRVFKDILGEEG